MAKKGSYQYIANLDWNRAKKNFSIEEYTLCGRLCEQSVEKYLKAFIEIKGDSEDIKYLRLHRPNRLYVRACELGFEIYNKQTEMELSRFTDYYYDTSYPGDAYFELTKEQAEEALELTTHIRSVAEEVLAKKLRIF